MRIAVVGAGIMGACAALELANSEHHVTVFEQFDVDHDRGSSYGDSRIIRHFYDDPYYTALMPQAYDLWHRLERESGQRLIEAFGGLYFGPRNSEGLAGALRGLHAIGSTAELLDAATLRARFHAFRFRDDETGLIDDTAGSLRASRCVRVAVDLARARGARLAKNVIVEGIARAAAGGVDVRIGGAVERFDRAVVCAGPWSAKFLPTLQLPIRVTRQQYAHFKPEANAEFFEAGAMPIWIDAGTQWYGFPHHGDVDGVKIASHIFGPVVDPDNVDRTIDPAEIERARAYANERLPALARGDVVYAKTCLYSVTPDEDFIVDRVDDVPGCVFIAGCSGHAFKFGALLGAIAADLTLEREPRADITRFRLARFAVS